MTLVNKGVEGPETKATFVFRIQACMGRVKDDTGDTMLTLPLVN